MSADRAVAAGGRRPLARWLFVAGLGAACAGFVALGWWQLERRVWKLDLIERVESRTRAAPSAPPSAEAWAQGGAAAHEYRRIALQGRFLPQPPTRVRAVTELGAGFWLLSPLRLVDGGTVLVNRGYVAPEWTPAPPPFGDVRLLGLVRASEPGGGFLRSNAPGEDRWYSRDVAAIAAARGLGSVLPYFVDAARGSPGSADAAPGPVAGLTVLRFNNNHLQYALTWFVLAAMALAGAIFVARDRR